MIFSRKPAGVLTLPHRESAPCPVVCSLQVLEYWQARALFIAFDIGRDRPSERSLSSGLAGRLDLSVQCQLPITIIDLIWAAAFVECTSPMIY